MAYVGKKTWTSPNGKLNTVNEVRWRHIDGKIKRKTFKKRKDAEEWRRKVEPLEPSRVALTGVSTTAKTVEEATSEYLNASKVGLNGKPPVEASSLLTMETVCRAQICPRWGQIKLTDLTPSYVITLRDQLVSDQRIERSYQRLVWRHFKATVAYMTSKGVFAVDPVAGTAIYAKKRESFEEGEVQIPTLQEAKAIVDLAREWSQTMKNKKSRRHWKRSYVMTRLGFETGLRLGELAALPLHAVNLQTRTIKVVQTAKFNVGVIGKPKTSNAYREVALSSKMTEELRWYIDEVRQAEESTFVFATQSGDFVRYSSLRAEMWVPLLKALDLVNHEGKAKYTPHSMRHFRASTLIRSGANHLAIKKELGHSKIELTINLYGHLFKEDDEARRQKVEEISTAVFG